MWRPPRLRFDWAGAVVSAAALALLIAGSAVVSRGAIGWILAGAGLMLLVVFITIEGSARSPLVSMDELRKRPVLLRALTLQLLTYAGAFGTSFLFALYLQEARGWSAVEAGRILVISPVLMACLAPVAGRMAESIRPQLLSAIGVTLICCGSGTAWLVPGDGFLTLMAVSLCAHGIGFAMFSSPNMTVIMSSIPREYTGMASALASQMRTLGMVFSMILITAFFSLNLGAEGLDADRAVPGLIDTMHGALAAICTLSLLAVITAWRDAPTSRAERIVTT